MDGRGYWDALSVTGAGLPSSFAGPLSLIQRLLLTGVSSPANLVGANANVNVLGDGSVGRLTCDPGASLSGMTGGEGGRLSFLFNAGANDLTLTHDAASTAANRFLCPGGTDYLLSANSGVLSWYDTTSSRWRIVSDPQSGGVSGGISTEFWVDVNAAPGGTGSAISPFQTPQEAVDALALTAYTAACINLAPGDHDTAVTVSAGYQITFRGGGRTTTFLSQTAGMTFVVDSANEVRFEDLTVGDILIQDSGAPFPTCSIYAVGVSFWGTNIALDVGATAGGLFWLDDCDVFSTVSLNNHSTWMRNGSSFQSDTLLYDLTASNSSVWNLSVEGGVAVFDICSVTGNLTSPSLPGAAYMDPQSNQTFNDSGGTLTNISVLVKEWYGPITVNGTGITNTIDGTLSLGEALRLIGATTPGAIAGANNDYDAFSTNTVVSRISGAAASSIQSITNGVAGRFAVLINVGANAITLANEGTGTAANRVLCPSATDFDIEVAAAVVLWYDTTSSRWRVIATSTGTGGGGSTPVETTVTPAAQQDDYSPTNWSTTTYLRVSATASLLITGFAARAAGTVVQVRNTSQYLVVLPVEASASTAANRIVASAPAQTHIVLLPGDSVDLVYDGTLARWVPLKLSPVTVSYGIQRLSVPGRLNTPGGSWVLSGSGTLGTPTPAGGGTYADSVSRTTATSKAATLALFGLRSAAQTFLTSQAGGLAGFVFTVGWGITTDSGGTEANYFVGVEGSSGTAIGASDPSALDQNIGFAMDPADTNWYLQHSDTTTPSTRVDLGANFPRDTTSFYRGVIISMPGNVGVASYVVWRQDDLTVLPAIGDISTEIPSVGLQGLAIGCTRASAVSHVLALTQMGVWTPEP